MCTQVEFQLRKKSLAKIMLNFLENVMLTNGMAIYRFLRVFAAFLILASIFWCRQSLYADIKIRPLIGHTPIENSTVDIIIGSEDYQKQSARKIVATLKEMGIYSSILENPGSAAVSNATNVTIVIGNLADNSIARFLYFKLLCATDRFYPGPGGYEVRTLIDPFGTNFNVIHLGYSDEDGLNAAVEIFLEKQGKEIRHLNIVRATQLPLSDVEAIRNSKVSDVPGVFNSNALDSKGYLYYLTGDAEVGAEYVEGLRAMLSVSLKEGPSADIPQPHLFMAFRIAVFRLVENTGLLDEEIRQKTAQLFHDWIESKDGLEWLRNEYYGYSVPNYPRQNHGLISAFAIFLMSDWFENRVGEEPFLKNWRAHAETVFEPYVKGSWKPLCNGLGHAWFMSQPILFEYGLYDDDHRYFTSGGGKVASRYAKNIVNNIGWMPFAGSGHLPRQFPSAALRISACFYDDGEAYYIYNKASDDLKYYPTVYNVIIPRAFDCDIDPEKPTLENIEIIPVDPLLYNVWQNVAEGLAERAVDTPPHSPLEDCFDKIAIRSGWNEKDDYLLIDGISGGSHTYAGGGSLIEYSRLGYGGIVSAACIFDSSTENHSTITVTRDGQTGVVPGFAILEEHNTDVSGNIYLRIRLKDYAETDWVREIFYRYNDCVVIHDTVIAGIAGTYVIESHFQVPGEVELHETQLTSERVGPDGSKGRLLLKIIGEPDQLTIEDISKLLPGNNTERESWRKRYRATAPKLFNIHSKLPLSLGDGQSVSLTSLIQLRGQDEEAADLIKHQDQLLLVKGKQKVELRPRYFGDQQPVPIQHTAETVSPELIFSMDSNIAAGIHDGENYILGSESGWLCKIDVRGKTLWTYPLEQKITDIAVAGERILVGCEPDRLVCLSSEGETLWSKTIQHVRSPWPWWELGSAVPVKMAGIDCREQQGFVVGCGDIQLRFFDLDGSEKWRWRYGVGVPARIVTGDMNNDGNEEILVGGDIISSTSNCHVLSCDGKPKAVFAVEGWTSVLTALSRQVYKEKAYIACGANRGSNFYLFDAGFLRSDKAQQPFFGYDRTADSIMIRKKLGGAVRGIEILPEERRCIVATSKGFVQAYDFDGNLQWLTLFEEPVQHIQRIGSGLISVSPTRIYILDIQTGSVIFHTEEIGRIGFVEISGKKPVFSAGSHLYKLNISTDEDN